MRASPWLTVIGVIESLLALWGIGTDGFAAVTGEIDSVVSTVSAAVLVIISATLLVGGFRLIRRDERAGRPTGGSAPNARAQFAATNHRRLRAISSSCTSSRR
jgi:hypothetical protein